jgi:diacylglycerol kinase family enzyme
MKVFDHIAIIYNPKSTGDAPKMAKDLFDSVNGHFEVIQKKATLYPTKRAGDAIEIAYDTASKYARPLIISVSGDGGYNEVINGVMAAKKLFPAQKPVVAVMAAGNANDHRRVMRAEDTPLIRLIKKADIKSFDLISLNAKAKDFELQRYAHSYIGLGITSEVGHALNQKGKNRWNEIWLTLKTLKDFVPFEVMRDGVTQLYDSIVFANINEMAKFVKLDSKNTVHDNMFEVVTVRHRGTFHTIKSIFSAVVHGFKNAPSYSTYSLKLPNAQPVQLDGEIVELPENTSVVIKSHHEAIDSLF